MILCEGITSLFLGLTQTLQTRAGNAEPQLFVGPGASHDYDPRNPKHVRSMAKKLVGISAGDVKVCKAEDVNTSRWN